MDRRKEERPEEFSAVYFRAQCDGVITPETQGTPHHTIHAHTAEFRFNQYGFIICAFDGAGSEETNETNPFKFHINIADDTKHTKLEHAWTIVVDVCASEGIGLVKVLNMGELERKEAKREAEAKSRPPEQPKILTPAQEKKLREEEIIAKEQRRKKITVYCDKTDWSNPNKKSERVIQMQVALLMIQKRLIAANIQPAPLAAFDGRLRLGGDVSAYISYRAQASERGEYYVPQRTHITGWDPFASYYRLQHPIIPDTRGQNPFHKLIDSEQEKLVYVMLEQLERNYPNINDRLVILNMRDLEGKTPLHIAASKGHKDLYAALKRAGADEHLQNIENETPLQILTAPKQKEKTQKNEMKKKKHKEKENKHSKKEKKEASLAPSSISASIREEEDPNVVFKKLSQFKPPQLASQSSKPSEQVQVPLSAPTLPVVPTSKPSAEPGPQQVPPMTTRLPVPPPTERRSSTLLAPRATPVQQQLSSSAKPTAPSPRSHSPPQTLRQQNKAAFSAGVTAQAAPLKAPAPQAAGTETKESKQPPASTPSAPKGSS